MSGRSRQSGHADRIGSIVAWIRLFAFAVAVLAAGGACFAGQPAAAPVVIDRALKQPLSGADSLVGRGQFAEASRSLQPILSAPRARLSFSTAATSMQRSPPTSSSPGTRPRRRLFTNASSEGSRVGNSTAQKRPAVSIKSSRLAPLTGIPRRDGKPWLSRRDSSLTAVNSPRRPALRENCWKHREPRKTRRLPRVLSRHGSSWAKSTGPSDGSRSGETCWRCDEIEVEGRRQPLDRWLLDRISHKRPPRGASRPGPLEVNRSSSARGFSSGPQRGPFGISGPKFRESRRPWQRN